VAHLPDKAIDNISTVTSGAWRLYCLLARCRKPDTGKAHASVAVTMDVLQINRGSVYALRKELQAKGWATFSGDYASNLFGFESLKNQTSSEENKPNSFSSAIAQSEKSDCLNNQTNSADSKEVSKSPKNQTLGVVEKSEKSDCLNNQTNFIDSAEVGESLKNQTADVSPCINTCTEKETINQEKDKTSQPSVKTVRKTAVAKCLDPEGHKTLMAHLVEKTGPIPDGAAQGQAVAWLLNQKYSADDCRACLEFLLAQEWRTCRVSWLTVKKEIGVWKSKQKPNGGPNASYKTHAIPGGNRGGDAGESQFRAKRQI